MVIYPLKDNQILLSKDDRDGLMKDFYRLPQFEEFNVNAIRKAKTTHGIILASSLSYGFLSTFFFIESDKSKSPNKAV